MAAGRAAGDDDEPGIAAVIGDVVCYPGQSGVDVDDVSGPGRLGAQPVADRHADPAALDQVAHQRVSLDLLVPSGPGTPGDLDEDRSAGVGSQVGMAPDVEQVERGYRAVGDVPVQGVPVADAEQLERGEPSF